VTNRVRVGAALSVFVVGGSATAVVRALPVRTVRVVALRADACEGGGGVPSLAEVADPVSQWFEGAGLAAKVAGIGETAVGTGLEAAGKVAGYAFAWAAFNEANAAFDYTGKDPPDPDFRVVFTPVFVPVPAVKAPNRHLEGAFLALNRLFAAQTRFAEAAVAFRVSLNRAEGAAAAGNPIWKARQADASARNALQAFGILQELPGLDAAVEHAFVADGLQATVTPQQFVAAQQAIAQHGLPPEVTHLLAVAAGALRPQSNSEVVTLKMLLLDTTGLEQAVARARPTAEHVPSAPEFQALASAEAKAAAALQTYANDVLTPSLRRVQSAVTGQDCGGGGASAGSYGEPHEVTFSGDDYEFQGAGEFTLVKSTTDSLAIQIREQPFPGAVDVAINTATAMRVGPTIVELVGDDKGRLHLWIDRKQVPLASQPLDGGGTLSVKDGRFATVTWPDGTQATVYSATTLAVAHQTATCNVAGTIYVDVSVPHSRFGHLTGLLGDAGAHPFSDLIGGNGVHYPYEKLAYPSGSVGNYDLLYHQFGQSWRISQQSSLFAYPAGTTTKSYTNTAFPSKALTISSLTPTKVSGALKACKKAGITNGLLLADCVFDVGVTGSSCFANDDADVQVTTGGPAPSSAPPSSGSTSPATPTTTTSTTTTSPTTTTAVSGFVVTVTAGTPRAYAFKLSASTQSRVVSDTPGVAELSLPAGEVTFEVTNSADGINAHSFEVCATPLTPAPAKTLVAVQKIPDHCAGTGTGTLAAGATATFTVDFTAPGAYEYLSTYGGPSGDASAGMKGVLNVT
jgi:plastocyanin